MALFQKVVLKKHLNDLNQEQLQTAWKVFRSHFHNPAKQENIRNSKEEQYQEGFFRDLFVDVLGYTLNPTPSFNLLTEYKNEKDSKKADGAILRGDTVAAVIELKGTDTTDLSKIETQVFSYKNNQKDCTYVISSNFEKLRFYINDAVDHVEFNLFTLSEKDFAVLYCCLKADAILSDTPLKMKQASLAEEENVTKKLYADYSNFKRRLFHSIAELNPQYDKLTLYKKTQKLLDRFLFILFAEDRLLVPPNSVREMLKDWEQLNEMDSYVPLYDRFKKYFGYLNNGYDGKKYEIFAYNGGLFAADEILDNVKIEDTLLYDATKQLSQYDFESEVDVNILGHIFEHSLSEIEEMERQLSTAVIPGDSEGPVGQTTSKRKKDGVFYTPRYITKYIVENTVGALCTAKKEELLITDEAFTPQKRKDNTKKLQQKLEEYRQWLLQLTICDPACGSGAFLNQALEFLINEHRYVDSLTAKLFGDAFVLSDVENSILENNLFGVDINEEAVEIARLSLWLRTARKGRKLNNLNNNIKCGNSLIDDKLVVGDKAFNWKDEFKSIFAKGGFDVIIGNPPYVFGGNDGISLKEKDFYKETYKTGGGKVNLFTLFIEKSYFLLRQNGEFSFIIPNTFLRVTSYEESRKFFIENFQFRELADLGADVFQDAVTTAIILVATKKPPDLTSVLRIIKDFSGISTQLSLKDVKDNNYIITTNTSGERGVLLKKIASNSIMLGTECKEMIFGVVITKNKDEVVSEIQHAGYKPFLEGKDITSYEIRGVHLYLNYKPELLHRARTKDVFEVSEKLLVQRITGGNKPLKVAYDNFGYYSKESINNIILNPESAFKAKLILVLLNSKLINWFYNNQFTNESMLTVNISKEYLSKIPVRNPQDQDVFIGKADIMISKKKELREVKKKLQQLILSKYESISLTKKLDDWPSLSFKEFLKELEKQKIKLSLAEQSEWVGYFETEKAKANSIQQIITNTDKEIDRMVYELYQLTDEEVRIVEN